MFSNTMQHILLIQESIDLTSSSQDIQRMEKQV